MEQLNIIGKRSGEGFVAHKSTLIEALSKAQAGMVEVAKTTIGRKGFVNYLKALDGSNIIKVVPAEGNQGLKVVCGANQGYIPNHAWVTEKLKPFTCCEVRISPHNAVSPNLGSVELADALSKVVPFAERGDEARQTLRCVKFASKDGKLILTASDGFRLIEASLDFLDTEFEALVEASELAGLISALRKAKRVKVGIEAKTEVEGELVKKSLVIDTEAISYKLRNEDYTYPDYGKVFPTQFVATAHVDTKAMLKACQSLAALSLDKQTTLKLTIVSGMVRLEAGELGRADIEADTEGEGTIGINAEYLAQTLKACGNGIVEIRVASRHEPILFSLDGVRSLVMPKLLPEDEVKTQAEAKAEAQAEAEAEAQAGTEAKATPKKSRKTKAKEPVAVA